ncbi:MAG: hypothetical protein WC967_12010 [Balneolaceae bacterium]
MILKFVKHLFYLIKNPKEVNDINKELSFLREFPHSVSTKEEKFSPGKYLLTVVDPVDKDDKTGKIIKQYIHIDCSDEEEFVAKTLVWIQALSEKWNIGAENIFVLPKKISK